MTGADMPTGTPDLAAVLVLYALDVDPGVTLKSVGTVAKHIVLVDNSPTGHPAAQTWSDHPTVTVLRNANRGGLAGAYNLAIAWLRDRAPQTGQVVFIDDDSDAAVLAAFVGSAEVQALLARPDTAAVAPAHRDRATGLRASHIQLTRWAWRHWPREHRGAFQVSFVINSMSVWRAEALERIGSHNEWLGVDHVDSEYCLRAADLGLAVYVHGDFEFAQSIGQRTEYRLFGRRLQSGGYGPTRRHSIARTTSWLALRYSVTHTGFALLCLVRLCYEGVGVVMAEGNRIAKLGALVRGSSAGIAEALRGAARASGIFK